MSSSRSMMFLFVSAIILASVVADTQKKPLSILMVSMPVPGHLSNLITLGEELRDQGGHNITYILPEFVDYKKSKELCLKHGFTYIPIPLNMSFQMELEKDAARNITVHDHVSNFAALGELLSNLYASINSFIANEQVDFTQYDLAVISDWFIAHFVCGKNTAHLRFVSCTFWPFPLDFSLLPPWPFPSLLDQDMTHDLTFTDRLKATIIKVISSPVYHYLVSSVTASNPKCWKDKYNNYLPSGHSVPFIIASVIGFEYPKSMLPSMHYVGPFIPKTMEPLPNDIENWLSNKPERSVIYISMGSLVTGTQSQKMARALYDGIPNNYSVLWTGVSDSSFFDEQPIKDGRFFIKSWMPQITVLSHPAISIAVVHGGAGGVHQSLYYGVPMIVIPYQAEQPGNAIKVHYWELGIRLDHEVITAKDVQESVQKIESGPYRDNAKKMSIIFKNAGGVKRAAELVEFYARVGYDHLVPAYVKYHWSWIQYYNVDVQALLLVIGALLFYFAFKLIKSLCFCCCCKKQKQKQE